MTALTKSGQSDRSLIMSLAWPSIVENITATLVTLVDTAMVGSLGTVATAAVGVCASPSWLMNGLVQSVGIGGTALVARAVGAGDRQSARHIGRQVYRIIILVSVVFAAFMFFVGAPWIPVMMQAREEVLPEARAYLRIVSSCYLLHYTAMAMASLLRGAGDTRTPMVCGLMSNLLNVVGNFFLIYPVRTISVLGSSFTVWGADMGVRGAAAASALAMGISSVYLLVHLGSKKSVLRLTPDFREPFDTDVFRRVIRVSVPAALERVAINLGQILFARMISGIGTVEVAAYIIAIDVEGFGYMPAFGFSAAATTLVGQCLGRREPENAERIGSKCIRMALWLLTVIGILMWVLSYPLASLMSSDPQVVMTAAAFIAICAFEQPCNAVMIVTGGALRGAGDTAAPFYIGLVSMWCVRIFGAWLFGFVFGLGALAIFWAMVADLFVRSVLLLIRFRKGKWKTIQV